MQLGFYPGCSLEGGSREYSESVIALCKAADIELVQIPDWNCCGASAAHNLNKKLSLALPARILAQAEKAGMQEIVVPCAACYSRLAVTQHELNNHTALKTDMIDTLGMEYKGNVRILNVIQMIDKYITPKLESLVKTPFAHKVACYYGCLMVRPQKVLNFDRPENPMSMDIVMQKLGATTIDWPFKSECCGAGFSMSKTEAVARLSGKIVQDATDRQAEAIIVACPMCQSNLDMRRKEINKFVGKNLDIPVIYVTQAMGLAMGISAKELGIERHFVKYDLK